MNVVSPKATYNSYHHYAGTDWNVFIGQLKWHWFQKDHLLRDVVSFDSATRGPLGSLVLLRKLGLQNPLASCGAFITILMLGVDPFTQQIIRYYNCSQPMDLHRATIPRTNVCQGTAGTGDPADGTYSVEPGLQDAVDSGIYSPGSHVTSSCATGNCSFSQPYDTLAYCSSCTDLIDQVQVQVNLSASPNDADDPSSANYGIISLPPMLQINSTKPSLYQDIDVATMTTITSKKGNHAPPNIQVEFLFVPNPTAIPGILPNHTSNTTCDGDHSDWTCQYYGAAVCTMIACIRTYTGAISVGNFDEKLVADWNGTIWVLSQVSPNYLATIDTECITFPERNYLEDAGYYIDPEVRWLPYNLTFDLSPVGNSSPPFSMLQHGCLYTFDQGKDYTFGANYLNYFFNGTITQHTARDDKPQHYDGPECLQKIYNHGAVTFESLNSTFRNISESITTYLRQSCDINHSDPAIGSVMHDETCLQVRWVWLAFPSALVFATVLFFIVTVITTRPAKDGAQIWKSSPLALLLHGLKEPNHHNVTYEGVQEMERIAENTIVRLATTEHGTNLVAVDSEDDDDNKEEEVA